MKYKTCFSFSHGNEPGNTAYELQKYCVLKLHLCVLMCIKIFTNLCIIYSSDQSFNQIIQKLTIFEYLQ